MAVNKNFVVKNGLQVGADIIVASVVDKNVGIGTTVGQILLDVRGAIGATHLSVSGVGTIVTLNATDFTSTNGTITNLTGTAGTIGSVQISSGIITATSGVVTYYGDGSGIIGVRASDSYWVQNDAGIHTTGSVGVGTTNPNSVVPSDNTSILNVGILTAYKLYGDGSELTGLAGNPSLQIVLDTGNTSTTGMSITGVSTFTAAEVTNLTGTAATIGTVQIVSGIVTATSGIITYYGDGSGLTGAGSTVADDTTTNETFYPIFTQTTSGVITASKVSTTKFTFNPSTGEASATNFNSTSDESLKTNIHTVENSLDIVDQLRGVSFDWKENGKSSYGVIAQELEQVLPELVAQTNPKSVNYNGIIGVLIESIKELKKEIEKLKSS